MGIFQRLKTTRRLKRGKSKKPECRWISRSLSIDQSENRNKPFKFACFLFVSDGRNISSSMFFCAKNTNITDFEPTIYSILSGKEPKKTKKPRRLVHFDTFGKIKITFVYGRVSQHRCLRRDECSLFPFTRFVSLFFQNLRRSL